MPAGLNALQKAQAFLESTRGTPAAATRIVYFDRGAWFEQVIGRDFPDEDRNSFIDFYRQLTTSHAVKLSGGADATFDDLAWWGQIFWKGGVTGVLSNTTVYTYTFQPTVASDDLKTATLEIGNDTQAYQIPYCLGEKLEISWKGGEAVKMAVDLLGQQLTPQAFTGSLSDRTLEDLVGTTAKVWIDNGGGTIGTTQALNVLSGKLTWENKWTQLTHLRGNLYPDDAQRDSRSVQLELDVHFNNTTEFAQLVAGGERLIRVQFSGSNIAGSSPTTAKTATFDFFGFYTSAPFSAEGPIRVVKLVARSVYDTTAAVDWKVAVVNQLVTLP